MAQQLRIGEVAQLLGISTKTIRHYQRLGLLDDSARSDTGYRLFTAADLLRLLRIRRLQGLGLPLAKIRQAMAAGEATTSLRAALAELLRDVDRQLAELQARRCSTWHGFVSLSTPRSRCWRSPRPSPSSRRS